MSKTQFGKFSHDTGKIEIKNVMDSLLHYGVFVDVPIMIILAFMTYIQANLI
jgi:hypothetical protein